MIRKIVHIDEEKCNGCGACTVACHEGAIVMASGKAKLMPAGKPHVCPGSMARSLNKKQEPPVQAEQKEVPQNAGEQTSRLAQWPVQIKLVPVNAPYFENAQLLIAADCTAYAYAGFHEKFMKDHVTLIGCPKLDEGDYADKLAEIIGNNSIRSIRIVRMEVPCCGGIENAVIRAMERSGKMIPWQVVTIACDGTIREEL